MAQPRVISKAEMERCFDGAAPSYDKAGDSPFARWGERLVELLDLREGERVLDVATGTGAVLLPAAMAVGAAGHVTGTDLSAAMVAEAGAAAGAAGLTNVSLRQCDAEHLPFDDASFDVATCAFSFFMFHDLAAAFRGMQRVVRPGGRIGLSLFGRSPSPFEPGWPVFGQQAMEWGVATRVPQRVAYEPDEAESMLVEHGLVTLAAVKEKYEIVFPTFDAWWAFQLTLGTRATILGMDEETRERFKQEHFARLREVWSSDGLRVRASVVYAVCEAHAAAER